MKLNMKITKLKTPENGEQYATLRFEVNPTFTGNL
jgi:hypothetical protein